MARGSVGLRKLDGKGLFAHISSAIIPRENFDGFSIFFNNRITSYLIRAISARIQITESYICRLPIPEIPLEGFKNIESLAIDLKKEIIEKDITERSFFTLRKTSTPNDFLVAATLHTLEGFCEKEIFNEFKLDLDDTLAVISETGTLRVGFP